MDKPKVFIRAEVVPVKKIHVHWYYRKTEPKQWKIDRCLSFFFDNGYFQDVITIDEDGYLDDGYIKYLFLLYSGVEKTKVMHVVVKETVKPIVETPITPPEPIKKPTWFQRLRQDLRSA